MTTQNLTENILADAGFSIEFSGDTVIVQDPVWKNYWVYPKFMDGTEWIDHSHRQVFDSLEKALNFCY